MFYDDEGFGPPIAVEPVLDETLKKYQNKLPNQLLKYWNEFGFSGWGNGLFWLVNPGEYHDVLDAWLENIETPTHEEYFVIARSAFGDLHVWGTVHGNCYKISSTISSIFPTLEEMKQEEADYLVRFFFASQDKKYHDFKDYKNKPLFERAVKKYGPLTKNEMFGFEPALILGGEA